MLILTQLFCLHVYFWLEDISTYDFITKNKLPKSLKKNAMNVKTEFSDELPDGDLIKL